MTFMAGRDIRKRFAFSMVVLAMAACTSDSLPVTNSYQNDDVRYVWPDEGSTAPPTGIEGATGFIGPHKASQVAQACAMLSGCFDEAGVDICMKTIREYWRLRDQGDAGRILQGSSTLWPPEPLSLATEIECVSAAQDCETIRGCISTSTPCGGCAGNALVACRDPAAPMGFKVDCSGLFLQCVETANAFSASCGAGTCNETKASCEGTKRTACELGISKEFDCATGNLVCETDGSENAQCRGKSGSCAPETDVAVCVESLARNCIGGGWTEEDCSFLGDVGSHRCYVDSDSEGTQTAKCIFDAGCDPASHEPTCVEGVMTLCPSGRPITIDCEALGLGGCAVSPEAHCQGYVAP